MGGSATTERQTIVRSSLCLPNVLNVHVYSGMFANVDVPHYTMY